MRKIDSRNSSKTLGDQTGFVTIHGAVWQIFGTKNPFLFNNTNSRRPGNKITCEIGTNRIRFLFPCREVMGVIVSWFVSVRFKMCKKGMMKWWRCIIGNIARLKIFSLRLHDQWAELERAVEKEVGLAVWLVEWHCRLKSKADTEQLAM